MWRNYDFVPLTYNMQVTKLGLRSDRVDLTHVSALIFLLHITNVQKPCSMLIVRHTDTGIPCNHVIVNSQNGRLLKMHPCHLQRKYSIIIHKHYVTFMCCSNCCGICIKLGKLCSSTIYLPLICPYVNPMPMCFYRVLCTVRKPL